MPASPETVAALTFAAGLAAGWLLRGGRRESRAQPSAPAAPAAHVTHGQALLDGELQRLVRGGNKIEAIKRYRALTGSGLKESKDAVERIDGSA